MLQFASLIPLIGPLINGIKELKGEDKNKDLLSTKLALPSAIAAGVAVHGAQVGEKVMTEAPTLEQAGLSLIVAVATYIYCLIRKRMS